MSASSKGMLCTICRCTLSWIVALRAMGSVDPAERYDPPSAHQFPRHEVERKRRPILFVVGLGLKFGRVGVEGHQPLEDPAVDRQQNEGAAHGVRADYVGMLEDVMQQRPGLGAWGKRKGHDCHRSRSGIGRVDVLNLNVGD